MFLVVKLYGDKINKCRASHKEKLRIFKLD